MKSGLLILLLLLSFAARADNTDKITIAATDIEGLFDEKSPGAYDVIFSRLMEGRDDIYVMRGPILRIRRLFYARNADCLFVGINHKEFYDYKGLPFEEILVSASIKTIRLRLYTMPGEPVVSSMEQLRGKAVAHASGVSSLEEFSQVFASKGIETLRVEKNIQAFQMMEFGRVAAVAAYGLDIDELSRHLPGIKKYPHDENFHASESEDVIVCWRNPKTLPFMAFVNQRIAILKNSGELEAVLAR